MQTTAELANLIDNLAGGYLINPLVVVKDKPGDGTLTRVIEGIMINGLLYTQISVAYPNANLDSHNQFVSTMQAALDREHILVVDEAHFLDKGMPMHNILMNKFLQRGLKMILVKTQGM